MYSNPKPEMYSTWGEAKQSLNKSANPSWAGKYNLKMAYLDISKAFNSKNYNVLGSLEPYYAFRRIIEVEAIEYFDPPK